MSETTAQPRNGGVAGWGLRVALAGAAALLAAAILPGAFVSADSSFTCPGSTYEGVTYNYDPAVAVVEVGNWTAFWVGVGSGSTHVLYGDGVTPMNGAILNVFDDHGIMATDAHLCKFDENATTTTAPSTTTSTTAPTTTTTTTTAPTTTTTTTSTTVPDTTTTTTSTSTTVPDTTTTTTVAETTTTVAETTTTVAETTTTVGDTTTTVADSTTTTLPATTTSFDTGGPTTTLPQPTTTLVDSGSATTTTLATRLPATGSNSTGTFMAMAAMLIAVGGALSLSMRRRPLAD